MKSQAEFIEEMEEFEERKHRAIPEEALVAFREVLHLLEQSAEIRMQTLPEAIKAAAAHWWGQTQDWEEMKFHKAFTEIPEAEWEEWKEQCEREEEDSDGEDSDGD